MSFKVLKDINDSPCKRVTISSITVTIGDLLQLPIGGVAWTLVTSASLHQARKAIAMESATTAATTLLVQELNGTETVEANCVAGTASLTHNGDRMVATDCTSIYNSGTDSTAKEAIFIQSGIGSTTSKIVGRVVVGSGVNPGAA